MEPVVTTVKTKVNTVQVAFYQWVFRRKNRSNIIFGRN